jgi:hypothetical protein
MDIKLGTTLYDVTDPTVTEAKRLKMEEKARTRSSTKTGMAITGFQVRRAIVSLSPVVFILHFDPLPTSANVDAHRFS